MHAQFAAGGNDRFTQNFEVPEFLERKTEIDFFAGKILLVKTANCFERGATGEEERARAQFSDDKVNRRENAQENFAPQGQSLVHCDARAPSAATLGER